MLSKENHSIRLHNLLWVNVKFKFWCLKIMSMKKIRRRLSQTFRFSIEGSLSELAEHLTIDDGGNVKENGES